MVRQFFFVCLVVLSYFSSLANEPFFSYQLKNAKANNAIKENDSVRRGSWVRNGTIQKGDVVLANNITGCTIVVGANEPSAVQQAARFLAKDIQKISGYTPPIVNQASNKGVNIRLVTVGSDEIPKHIKTKSLAGKWEAYQIITKNNTVWLIGSDFRGTAFAAYTLSERLGIDPLYLWTGYEPTHLNNLVLKLTNHVADSPTIKYRGFFHDDEDILPEPFDEFGHPYRFGNISIEWYRRYFETALRLRMNMVAPYTRVRRHYEIQKCASDWGLFYTSHHYDVLLSNPFGIERFNLADKREVTPDWDWFNNKGNMIKYWQAGVEENKELSVIWPVSLRGTDDRAYDFPENTTAEEQAKVFGQVLEEQVKLVKDAVPSNRQHLFHFTMYTEMLDKYQKNKSAFKIPKDVIIVWPDNNDGTMRNLPAQPEDWKHGVYYHLAYYGGDLTKQSIHTVSPKKITTEFKKIINSGATEFLLVNVSEMREFVMESRLIAEIAWDAPSVLNGANPEDKYLNWWSREYFGNNASVDVSEIYDQYFELLSTPTMKCYGSNAVQDVLDRLSKKFNMQPYKDIADERIATLEQRSKKYQTVIRRIEQVSKKMTESQSRFFFENVTLGLLMDYRPTMASLILLKALAEPDHSLAMKLVEDAINPLENLEIEIAKGERSPFENWYAETWIRYSDSQYNVHRPYEQLKAFIAATPKVSPIKPRDKVGHRIQEHKLWSKFLDEMEKLN